MAPLRTSFLMMGTSSCLRIPPSPVSGSSMRSVPRNPRSATFFFDNCYSGATRSEQQLLAARPLTIKVEETDVPDNYLVFAAGETDQIAENVTTGAGRA